MMTAFGSEEKALECMEKGAYDYIFKPFQNEQLKLTIRKAINHYRLVQRNRDLSEELKDRYQLDNIIGKSAAMRRIFQLIEMVAPSKATVLITGESGTGKELIARSIHYNSNRRIQPFISVNCGALPESLLESELFGHEKGSFSGALADRTFTGVVDFVDPRVELPGRTITVKARVPNRDRVLKPGMFIEAALVAETRLGAVVVPEDAVLPVSGADHIWVVVDGKATRRQVTLGVRVPGFVEVQDGVAAGEQVVVGGLERLFEGADVQANEVERG